MNNLSPAEIVLMKKAGEITRDALNFCEKLIKPGISTKELDNLVEKFIINSGGLPACKGYEGYPATICASANDMVVHGIPSDHVILKEGDIISIDIPAHKLEVKISDEEMAARKANWQPREPKVTTGYLARYREMVTSGNRGAILEIKK